MVGEVGIIYCKCLVLCHFRHKKCQRNKVMRYSSRVVNEAHCPEDILLPPLDPFPPAIPAACHEGLDASSSD
jgi:hypothetical protein